MWSRPPTRYIDDALVEEGNDDHLAVGDEEMTRMAFSAAAAWTAVNEARVRADFWKKIKSAAAHIPFVEDALTAYYCAFDRETPLHVRAALWGALAYFILPFDAIPDYLPVIGYTDDAAVLAAALRLVASHIKPEHREAARRALKRLEDGI
jgi:uncharacterized membrane protein YkvA (DUF1232 family)